MAFRKSWNFFGELFIWCSRAVTRIVTFFLRMEAKLILASTFFEITPLVESTAAIVSGSADDKADVSLSLS